MRMVEACVVKSKDVRNLLKKVVHVGLTVVEGLERLPEIDPFALKNVKR